MSYESTADLFWGFPIDDATRERVDRAGSRTIVTGIGGDDSDHVHYIAVKASMRQVSIGSALRLDTLKAMDEWWAPMSKFCGDHGIEWPKHGPGWYVTPARF